MAFTDLRFLQIIQESEEDYLQIGQKEIKALIQIDLMKSIVDNLKKAELYEKAIEIFNQMKNIFENAIFDYDAVSRVLVICMAFNTFRKSNQRSTRLCL